MGHVVRMIHRVVRMFPTGPLINSRSLYLLYCMLMSVIFFWSGRRRLMRFNNSGQAMGTGESNR